METTETKALGRVYLSYLGILPALATFAILWRFGHPHPFLVFLGGVVAVSVYLAAIYSYTQLPKQLLPALMMLLDGPSTELGSSPTGVTAPWVSVMAVRRAIPSRVGPTCPMLCSAKRWTRTFSGCPKINSMA